MQYMKLDTVVSKSFSSDLCFFFDSFWFSFQQWLSSKSRDIFRSNPFQSTKPTKILQSPSWNQRNRKTDTMPVRVVQSEVSPPFPVNSKQVKNWETLIKYIEKSISSLEWVGLCFTMAPDSLVTRNLKAISMMWRSCYRYIEDEITKIILTSLFILISACRRRKCIFVWLPKN